MKLYEVEVVAKIAIHGIDEQDAKTRAVAWVQTDSTEAIWWSCKEAKKVNK